MSFLRPHQKKEVQWILGNTSWYCLMTMNLNDLLWNSRKWWNLRTLPVKFMVTAIFWLSMQLLPTGLRLGNSVPYDSNSQTNLISKTTGVSPRVLQPQVSLWMRCRKTRHNSWSILRSLSSIGRWVRAPHPKYFRETGEDRKLISRSSSSPTPISLRSSNGR